MRASWMGCGIALALAALVLTGCASTRGGYDEETGGTQKLSRYMYYDEGEEAFFLVNAQPAMANYEREVIPLEIAVANKGLDELAVSTEEGVTLRRKGGGVWTAVSLEDNAKLRMKSQFDRKSQPQDLLELMNTRFGIYRFFPPNFGFRQGDRAFSRVVELPRFAYTIGTVYIDNPDPGGLSGETYEAWFEAPELERPVFVTFSFPRSSE